MQPPAIGKLVAAPDFEPLVSATFRHHEQLPVMLEEERKGEMAVGGKYRPHIDQALGAQFSDADAALVRSVVVRLEETVRAAEMLPQERIRLVLVSGQNTGRRLSWIE